MNNRSIPSRVVVYDPNHLNPYGMEVAEILTESVNQVEFWGTSTRSYPPSRHFRVQGLLSGPSTEITSKVICRRILEPVRVIRSAGLDTPLVLIWIRDPWDCMLFLWRSLRGGRTLFVCHNPEQIRPRRGFVGWLERRLMQRSTVCVHSPWMADLVRPRSREVVVTPHPPYSFASRGGDRVHPQRQPDPRPRVALLGALREDKGSQDLADIARASRGGWILRIVGPSMLSPTIAAELLSLGVEQEYATLGRAPTDLEVHDALLASDVVIAPYRRVTESGSVLLALSLGVPVLGYRSHALDRVVTESSLASDAGGLGSILATFLKVPWETFRVTPAEIASESGEGWKNALA